MFEWLIDYQKMSEDVEYLDYRLGREKRELERWTKGDLEDVPLKENSIASGLEERIEILEYELAHKMNDLFNAKRLIFTFKGVENKILYYKYVEGMKLNEVADELNHAPGYIYNKHAEIMKRIDFAHKLMLT